MWEPLPSLGEVGPVRNHVSGQVSVSRKVDQRGGERFAKEILEVFGVLRLHPFREAWDAGLHIEQVRVRVGSTGGSKQQEEVKGFF